MATVKNENFVQHDSWDSPTFWFGKLVFDSMSGLDFQTIERPATTYLGQHAPATFDEMSVTRRGDTDLVQIEFKMEGEDEELLSGQMVGLSLHALKAAGVDLEELSYRGGHLANGEQLYHIMGDGQGHAADLDDPMFDRDEIIRDFFIDLREMMVEN